MSHKSCVVLTAALLCFGLPVFGQELPDGPGKELAAANCNSCHTLLSRVGAGYTPEGWRTVLRMMANQGATVPADQVEPLREYRTKSFPEKGKPITTRHLLGHLSGIRHYGPNEDFNSTRHYDGVVASLDAFKNDPLLQDPGTKFTYSTYGYVVLGCVVEGASARKFADQVRESLTAPAGMDRTRPDDESAIVAGRAHGYEKAASGDFLNAALADTSNKVPGGGFVSTSPDLVRFALALWQGKLVRPETFRQMQVPMKTSDGKDSPYFGWTIADRRGDTLLTHGGSQQGTSTYLLMLPAKGFAVAVIANTEGVNVGELARQIADILLPEK